MWISWFYTKFTPNLHQEMHMKLPKIIKHGNKYRVQFTKDGQRITISKDTYEACEKALIVKFFDIVLLVRVVKFTVVT